MKRSLAVSVAVALLLLAANAAAAQVTLTSVSVSPSGPGIPVPLAQQFMAVGHFSAGTARDMTQVVAWSSSSTLVATVSNTLGTQGLATAKAAGATTNTAKKAGEINTHPALTTPSRSRKCFSSGSRRQRARDSGSVPQMHWATDPRENPGLRPYQGRPTTFSFD